MDMDHTTHTRPPRGPWDDYGHPKDNRPVVPEHGTTGAILLAAMIVVALLHRHRQRH